MSCYDRVEEFSNDYCELCVHSMHSDNSECHWCMDGEDGEPTMFETQADYLNRLALEEW